MIYEGDKVLIGDVLGEGRGLWDALVHFYFQEDPDKMTLDRYAKLYCRLEAVLEFTGKMKSKKAK